MRKQSFFLFFGYYKSMRKRVSILLLLIGLVIIMLDPMSASAYSPAPAQSVVTVKACPYYKDHISGINFLITTYKPYKAVFVNDIRATSISGKYRPYGVFWEYRKSVHRAFKKIGQRGYLRVRVSGFDGEARVVWASYKITNCRR